MRIERHDEPAPFFALVAPFLERREAEHNLQLGFRARLEADRHAYGPRDPLLYAVLDGGGERSRRSRPRRRRSGSCCRRWTTRRSSTRSPTDWRKTARSFRPPAARSRSPARSPIAGRSLTGLMPFVQLDERIYEATAVVHPEGVRGAMRAYTPADRPLAIDWLGAFFAEAMPDSPEGRVERIVDDRAAGIGSLVLWEDDGEVVSIAGHAGETPNGSRVGPVYTPPELRGRGLRVGADRSAHGAAPRAPPVLLPLHRPRESDLELDLPAHRVPPGHGHHALAVRRSRRQLNATPPIAAAATAAAARPETCAAGSDETSAGARLDVDGDPPVRPRERGCDARCERRNGCGREREPEQHRDRGLDERVRDDAVERHAPELEPQDRRGDERARRRDRDRRSAASRASGTRRARAGTGRRGRRSPPRHRTRAESLRRRALYGFHASSAQAATSSRCHASRSRPASQATDTAAPAIAARITDGCGPTASTYAPIAASAPTWPHTRPMPSATASASTPPASSTTFWPETASRW